MVSINIDKTTVVAFVVGFVLGFTRKIKVEFEKNNAKKEN